jgi:hypothetical protein
MYRLNGGAWIAYAGPVAVQPTVLIEAKSVSTNLAAYTDSSITHTAYYALLPSMSGNVSAAFGASSGPPSMVSTLNNSNPSSVSETDGIAASSSVTPNNFVFQRVATFSNVPPNTPFRLGTLTYTNGTVNSGTAATALDLKVTFNLTSPPEAATTGDVQLGLVSTSNTSNATTSADRCTLIAPMTSYSYVYGGITYTLKLAWGTPSISQGWITGDTLNVYEGATATVDLIATFVSQTPL